MDTLTQIALGAAVGQAACGRKLGGRAAIWGGVGGLIPDLDILVASPSDEFSRLVVHRGTSHSFWFCAALGIAGGYALWRGWYVRRDPERLGSRAALKYWIATLTLSLLSHPLLDVCTSYGTQLLAPFSRRRFVFEAIGIVDPLYTLILVVGITLAHRRRRDPRFQRVIAWGAVTLSSSYILLGALLNYRAVRFAEAQLGRAGIAGARVIGYSTILQLPLRRIVARTTDRVFVGYLSALDPSPIHFWTFQPERHALIDTLRRTREGRLFEWFASGQTVGRVVRDGIDYRVEIEDIRYGMPGSPDQGFWGIFARYDREGRQLGAVRRFSRERSGRIRRSLADIWPAALGHDARTYMVGVGSNAGR